MISAIGVIQIMAWGATYYLPAVLARPIAAETGWPVAGVVAGLSVALVVAGLASPTVGRNIARRGGRPVLATGLVLLAVGLCALGLAANLWLFLAAWILVGLGMAGALYDPAFATLARLYGEGGRSAITALTLFGGLASTCGWPLSTFFESNLGWRGACFAWAAILAGVGLPALLLVLPREPQMATKATPATPKLAGTGARRRDALLIILLTVSLTLAGVISTILSVHLLTVLQDGGLAAGVAVTLGAMVGPAQVSARAVELAIGRFHHPVWTKVAAAIFVTAGITAMWAGGALLLPAILFYGAGIGIESIARGTLPLAMFGPARYPILMGRMALPNMMLQAASPLAGSFLLETAGANGTLATLVAGALLNCALVGILVVAIRRQRS